MKTIDLNSWNRKEYFELFSQFEEPYFGIVADIDCSIAYDEVKKNNSSFFAFYLHKSSVAVNAIEEFKYRIQDEKIVLFDEIHASATIGRDDGTFAFSFVPYHEDFHVFNNSLEAEILRIQNTRGLGLDDNTSRIDTIHYSSVPWIKFTGLTHARNFKFADSVPKITFGKAVILNSKMTMPVSINAHHGLMDGLHVAKYLELFQKLMNNE